MMTNSETYLAVNRFLDKFWEERKQEFNDDLPTLLGSMMLANDGFPMDRAVWSDWTECVPLDQLLDEKSGFEAIKCFLRRYLLTGENRTHDISRLLELLDTSFDKFWDEWLKAITDVHNNQFN